MKKKNIMRNHTGGMTLLEMIISMAIIGIIFAAVIPQIRNISTTWGSHQANADVLQNSRVLSSHIRMNLSSADQITAVSSPVDSIGYIEFLSNDGNTMRYEVDGLKYVTYGVVGNLEQLAGPVTQFQFTCFDINEMTPITDVNSIRFVTVQATLVNENKLSSNKTVNINAFIHSSNTSSSGGGSGSDSALGLFVIDKKIDCGGSSLLIDAYRSFEGYGSSKKSYNATVAINAEKSNKLIIYSKGILRGDAFVGPKGDPEKVIDLSGGAKITGTMGTLEEKIPMPSIKIPNNPPFNKKNEGNFELWGSIQKTISKDHYYKNLYLWGQSTLKISGNVTILLEKNFELSKNAQLQIMPKSSLTLYIKGDCNIGGAVNANTADPSVLTVNMAGNKKTVETWGEGQIHARVYNPKGNLKIWDKCQFYGSYIGKNFEGNGGIHLDLDLIEGSSEEILP